jgi:hypothetical protein
MMDFNGAAMLALWNGVAAGRQAEYDLWHTREHVPQRLGVPGIRAARRYIRLRGPMPQYLTLYDVDRIDVFESAPYRCLLDNPTPWTRSMRPSFEGFFRLCCDRLLTVGGGLGCVAAAVTFDAQVDIGAPDMRHFFGEASRLPEITAIHAIRSDRSIAGMPFAIGGERPAFPDAGALILESYGATELDRAIERLRAAAAGVLPAENWSGLTSYSLAYAIEQASLERVVTVGPEAVSADAGNVSQ